MGYERQFSGTATTPHAANDQKKPDFPRRCKGYPFMSNTPPEKKVNLRN